MDPANPQTESGVVDLSVIIVSWNVADLLVDCLDSVLFNSVVMSRQPDQQPRTEVIVVDSASSDSTVERVRQRFPGVTLLPQAENVGFTRGNNIGLQAARGRYLLLLNPDTLVLGDALQVMVNHMDANPDVGMLGPYTLNTDGTPQSTRRRFPTLATAFFESTWLQPFAPQALLDRYYMRDLPDLGTCDVDWVQGSALMVRREVYEQIGGLDEGFVMYSEELDWCKRAKDADWRVVFLGAAQIIHHGGKSSDQVTAFKHIQFQRSKLRYFRKYHGSGAVLALRTFLLMNYAWQLGLESVKSLLGHKRDMRRERIRAYWQVLRSGLRAT